ncbi:alpha/beta fold hydrolase [Williamsia herbipolensis]|uniref:alpha/beta fold hydrolase n=1 Tax=Williamsia herbipolensis TaxID=1603258 RepID=UPI0005F7D027|nr:alpha/beta fold hydrolase [Williamsia herbipolensis]
MTQQPTYVLIPGACHGAWCFDELAATLRATGHRVLAYTLTGVSERAHLADRGVNLQTHIDDVVAALAVDAADEPLVLVGHSYGGMVITGVVDRLRAPERVAAAVYLDAFVPRDGESCWMLTNDEQRQWYSEVDASGFGVPALPFFDARTSAHPLASLMQRITLRADLSAIGERVYVFAAGWEGTPFAPTHRRLASDPAWTTHALPGGHNLMRDCPEHLASIVGAAGRGDQRN